MVSKHVFMSSESLVRLPRISFVVHFCDLLATSEAYWASFPATFPSLPVTFEARQGSSLVYFCLLRHVIFCLVVRDMHTS